MRGEEVFGVRDNCGRQMSSMFVITLYIKVTAAINEAFITSVAALHAPVMHIVRENRNVGNH